MAKQAIRRSTTPYITGSSARKLEQEARPSLVAVPGGTRATVRARRRSTEQPLTPEPVSELLFPGIVALTVAGYAILFVLAALSDLFGWGIV